jgi:N-acetylglutamate synthase-like GNAT family acetyltransferase
MKAYLITTGTVFGLLALAHVWRVIGESRSLGVDPWFVATSVISAAMSVWAFTLLRTSTRGQ